MLKKESILHQLLELSWAFKSFSSEHCSVKKIAYDWINYLFVFSKPSVVMKEAIALTFLCLVLTTTGQFSTMSPAKIRNLMKLRYCDEMQGQRVYEQEHLESDCTEKVQIFGEKARLILFKGQFAG